MCKKMHLKKVISERNLNLVLDAILSSKCQLSWNNVYRCIMSQMQVYIFEIYVKFCVIIYLLPVSQGQVPS
jgi:hypothetical protein